MILFDIGHLAGSVGLTQCKVTLVLVEVMPVMFTASVGAENQFNHNQYQCNTHTVADGDVVNAIHATMSADNLPATVVSPVLLSCSPAPA